MATEAERIQKISANIETAYQSMRRAARNITALLAVGRATCDEIKAYNLWCLALYNTQRGMLTSLRAAGEVNVPELPGYPTLFAWRGYTGEDAWRIDCNAEQQGLTGALRDAMQSDRPQQFVSLQQVAIITQDQGLLHPEKGPDLSMLVAATGKADGLGVVPIVWIVIAGIALAVGVTLGIVALARYLTEKSIQEETTERTVIQADAFEKYTAARMSCYTDCTTRGNTVEACSAACAKLVDKPNLKIDPARPESGFGFWGTIGVAAGLAATTAIAWKVWRDRHPGMAS